MLFLNRQQVESLLDPDQLIDALAPAMVDLSAGAVSMPSRIAAQVSDVDGLLGVMPAYVSSSSTLAAKLVAVFPRNADRGMHTHQALLTLRSGRVCDSRVIFPGSRYTVRVSTLTLENEDGRSISTNRTGDFTRSDD